MGPDATAAGPVRERETPTPLDFIRTIVADDVRMGKHHGRVATRFPPEPNGYLHIGHAKSICLNFGVAAEFGGICNLRYDDTNPAKEDVEYVESIQDDVRWLGFEWKGEPRYASDYFETLYGYAVHLIERGLAYVDSLSADEIRAYRGTLTEPGKESPFRTRSIDENLDLFARMRAGEFEDGAHVLRAKIDMTSPNLTCAIRCSTASGGRITTARATRGASIRCTTSRTRRRTRSRRSPTRSARSSSRITGRCTTGSWRTCQCRRGPGRSSSRG